MQNARTGALNAHGKQLVECIVDNYVHKAFKPEAQAQIRRGGWDVEGRGALPDPTTASLQQSLIRKFGENQHPGRWDAEHDVTNPTDVKFFLKVQFKPDLSGTRDPNKVGQGISAWSAEAASKYMMDFRTLSELVVRLEKDCVVTEHGMSAIDFMERAQQELAKVDYPGMVSRIAYTDFAAFDSSQNQFTQYIERYFLSLLGMSEEWLDGYYYFRSRYMVKGKFLKVRGRYEKTSGEPGTLFLNGVVSRMLSLWFVESVGPFCMLYKGDDFVYKSLGVRFNPARMDEVSRYVSLKIKAPPPAESVDFCGFQIVGGLFCPSVRRRFYKAVAKRYQARGTRSAYNHFQDYQQSIRDWMAETSMIPDFLQRAALGDCETSRRPYEFVFEETCMMWHALGDLAAYTYADYVRVAVNVVPPIWQQTANSLELFSEGAVFPVSPQKRDWQKWADSLRFTQKRKLYGFAYYTWYVRRGFLFKRITNPTHVASF
jgi:hypothetical protein